VKNITILRSVETSMDFENPPRDPIAQLNAWIEDARRTGLPNPNAMSLATVDAGGQPSARIVLLKGLDQNGAVFFTNRQSRKGEALSANPRAGLLFHWDALHRQVRIEGRVSQVSDAESDAYFATRPRESRIGAWASQQSKPAKDRAALDAAFAAYEQKFARGEVPRPPNWGGYRVSLDSIEFWQGHPFRLHDRVVYSADKSSPNGWRVQRLFP
jgi:pyridoxamine 5'-phosphate oxidase